jgi:putative intracellular protease/amidase
MSARSVLVVLSGSKDLDLRGGKTVETGFFLSELSVPLMTLEKAGYRIIFTNPTGVAPNMDPLSDHMVWFGSPGEYHKAKTWVKDHLEEHGEGSMSQPIPFSAWGEADLLPIDGLVVPGGHAPMIDLHNNQNLGYIIHHFHRHNKPTGLICHGPVALLSTNLAIPMDQRWPYTGYKMTAYSNKEEAFNELLWRDRLQFHVEDGLKDAGAQYEARWPLLPNVVTDRELITGQGPTSVWRFGEAVLAALSAYNMARVQSTPAVY